MKIRVTPTVPRNVQILDTFLQAPQLITGSMQLGPDTRPSGVQWLLTTVVTEGAEFSYMHNSLGTWVLLHACI